jgi:membrane protein required for colicin V production
VNFLDFLLLAIVVWSVIGGFTAGFARVSVGFAATVVGIFCGFWFYRIPGSFLADYLRSATAANLVGFFVVFALVVLAGGVVSKVLSRMFRWAGLSWLDRLLGAAFGFVRGALLAVAVATVVTAFAPKPPPRFIVDSQVMPYAGTAGNVFAALAPSELREGYHDTLGKLREIWRDVQRDAKSDKLRKESY